MFAQPYSNDPFEDDIPFQAPFTDEQAQFLSEIGFTAVQSDIGEDTEDIFKLLIAIYPDNASGYVGAAFSAIHHGEDEKALEYVTGEALEAATNVEMAWGVWLYIARRNPGKEDPDAIQTEMEYALNDEELEAAIELADELTGALDEGGTCDPDFSRLPNWIWRQL